MWKHMIHKNVLPLLGITSVPLQLISEWMAGGDLQEYIRRCPSSDRLELVGVLLSMLDGMLTPRELRDITEGLNFLHSLGVVHGDLKGVRDNFESLYSPHYDSFTSCSQTFL